MRSATAFLTEFSRETFRRPDWIAGVSPASLRADAIAGLTGATLVLPQGIAFAAIAGLPPQYGFYTAMVPPIVAAFLGSSWHAVSGPTTAISALVFGALAGTMVPGSPDYIAAAITLALLVGIFQLALGLMRFGSLVNFVSHSVMTGFVAAAALLIALSQIPAALGLDLERSETPWESLHAIAGALGQTDWRAGLIALFAFAVAFAVKRLRPLWPNYLVALAAATGLGAALGGSGAGIPTIGAIDRILPQIYLPDFGLSEVRSLGASAIAIGIVGLLEAMSIARALAQKSGQMIDGNREFVGQGSSNIIGSLFSCYPSSASFTRSGVNYDAGAKTPLSAVLAALFLFVILMLVAPLFAMVPIAALAGVIVLVAIRVVDFHEIRHLATTSRSESAIALATFGSGILFDLEFAIFAGVILSLALFLHRTATPFIGVGAPDPSTRRRLFRDAATFELDECPQMIMARLDGPFYFGSVDHIRRHFRRFEETRPDQKHLLLVLKGTGEIDMPGADLLIEESERRTRRGGSFHIMTRTPGAITKLGRFKVLKALSRDNVHLSKGDAIASLVPRLDPAICATCTKRIFLECPPPPGAQDPETGPARDPG